MNFFEDEFSNWAWDNLVDQIAGITSIQVESALARKGRGGLQDFLALISPAASPYLEDMASLSRQLTRQRFGNNVQMFLPVYLSNHCTNICTYCGFSVNNQTPRLALSREEVLSEIKAVKALEIDYVLLLTGEDNRNAGADYLASMVSLFKEYFTHVAVEVQPLQKEEYIRLQKQGLDAVYLYQETYHQNTYRQYHPRGKKSIFVNRLAAIDSLGDIGIHKLGVGVLLGLEDWRVDSFFCAVHLNYLKKHYWRTRFSVSFPRLRPAEGVDGSQYRNINEKDLAQLIFAYRIWDEDLELSLSTRESPQFRDNIIPLGITSISAGSKTNPGGYACYPKESLEQFSISDERSPEEMRKYLIKTGLEPVKKDWAKEFSYSSDYSFTVGKF